MRQPMRAAPLEPGADVHDWTTFARRGDTEPMIPVSIDMSEYYGVDSEAETLPSIRAVPPPPQSDEEIIADALASSEQGMATCLDPSRRSSIPVEPEAA